MNLRSIPVIVGISVDILCLLEKFKKVFQILKNSVELLIRLNDFITPLIVLVACPNVESYFCNCLLRI